MSTPTRELTEVEKVEHGIFLTTTLDALANWTRKNSLWPYPFGTACCAIECMAVASAHYDIARFGSEVVRFSHRQSDVLMVLGTINDKMGPVLKKIYDQTAEPRWASTYLGVHLFRKPFWMRSSSCRNRSRPNWIR